MLFSFLFLFRPEVDGYCALDIFTCGETDNFAALEVLKLRFEAKTCVVVEIERGKKRKQWQVRIIY
jgi:S-adenosylmethionine/arginine decarboxylase-like enzyme